MAETVFTCGHVLCLLDGVNLYGLAQTYEYNRALGEYLTGVAAPSHDLNFEKVVEIGLWLLATSSFCGEALKLQMVKQYPASFGHARLNKLVRDPNLDGETMLQTYLRTAGEMGIDFDTPLSLAPLSYIEQQKFLQFATNPDFRNECLNIIGVGTANYVMDSV